MGIVQGKSEQSQLVEAIAYRGRSLKHRLTIDERSTVLRRGGMKEQGRRWVAPDSALACNCLVRVEDDADWAMVCRPRITVVEVKGGAVASVTLDRAGGIVPRFEA